MTLPALSLTFNFGTTDEASAFLAKLGAPPTGKDAPTAVGMPAGTPATAEKRGPGRPRKEDAAPATQPSASSTPSTSSDGAAGELTEDQKKALYEKLKIGERIQKCAADAALKPKVIELLGKFGVKRGPELKVSDFEPFGAELDKLLAPAASEDLG